MNFSDICVDIETCSTYPNATILSISAVSFDPLKITEDFTDNPKLDLLLNIEEQSNRHIDENTIAWWSQQDPKVQAKMFGEENRVSVKDALQQFSKMCWNKQRIWAQGITFDITILENILRENNMPIPFQYFKTRDSRTLMDLVEVIQDPVTHDSLEDVIRQIKGTQQALSKLNVKKFMR